MIKRLLQLNGLAILAVVLNHASSWGITAMFWWAHRYRPVISPNFDQLDSPAYFFLVSIKSLTVFCIPIFLFVSSYFLSLLTASSESSTQWKTIRKRLVDLLIPYLIWSVIIYAYYGVAERHFDLGEFVVALLTGNAHAVLYYVIVITQLYLLTPFLLAIAKRNWRTLLWGSLVIQLLMVAWRYLHVFGGFPVASPDLLFLNWIFFFAFGIVTGFNYNKIQTTLHRFRWLLLALVLVLGAVSVVENEWIYRTLGEGFDWRGGIKSISSNFFAIFFILWMVSTGGFRVQRIKLLDYLGTRSYGIYLTHILFIELVSRVVYHVFPWMLAYQIIFILFVVVFTIACSLLLMWIFAKLKWQKVYRYLFG